MTSNPAASYEVPNDRGMNSISSKSGVQYTLDNFSKISIIEDIILGDSFFKIKFDDLMTIYKNAGLPAPNFNDKFLAEIKLDDPHLKQLVTEGGTFTFHVK